MADTSLIFTKLTIALQLFLVKNFHIACNENQANRSYTCRYEVVFVRTWSPKRRSFLLILNERQKIAVLLSEELTLKKNDTLLFHGHLLSRHQPQDLAFAKFSKPCLAVKCVSRNTCLNEEHNLAGCKHVQ